MTTAKISQLPLIQFINANTSNTFFIGVDVANNITGHLTVTTLAQGLYSNNQLVVGVNPISFSNTSAQFSGNDANFVQVNLQNFNSAGSGDYIVTADTGTNTGGFIDLGINNSQWNAAAAGSTSQYPLDGYLIVDGPGTSITGNLAIGTINSGTSTIVTIGGLASNNIVARFTANNVVHYVPVMFADGSSQNTAAASLSYSQASFALANSVNSYAYSSNAYLQAYASNIVNFQSNIIETFAQIGRAHV